MATMEQDVQEWKSDGFVKDIRCEVREEFESVGTATKTILVEIIYI